MRKSLVQQAAAEYSKRSRTKRTRAHGRCRYPPSLACSTDRPPMTGAAAFSDDAEKKRGGTRSAQAPRWKNAACRSPANRWGLGQSRRLASARCRVARGRENRRVNGKYLRLCGAGVLQTYSFPFFSLWGGRLGRPSRKAADGASGLAGRRLALSARGVDVGWLAWS